MKAYLNVGAEAEHTPTPWQISKVEFEKDEWSKLHNQKQTCVSKGRDILAIVYGPEDEEQPNAAFIVRAVNAYEKLLEACKYISDMEINLNEDYAIKMAKQAIAKATGETNA